jgi:flap endonuclease-1
MREGIFPCYVWDGEPPEFKHRVIQERQERKKIAKEAMLKAKTDEERRKFAQQISILTEDMIKDANKLLDALGVSHVQAPSEGEAQITQMVKNGDLWACASQDWDAMLFGSPRLIRNLSITGKRKLPRKQEFVFIYPELVDLKENLERLGITNDQLIIAAMLIGTDYCPGVKGYGPKKALALVQETKTLKKAVEKTGWDYDVAPEIIFEWFKKPKTTDNYNLEWKTPDREKIMKLLVDEHEFSQERVESQLKQLDTSKGKREQTGLSNFFK